jgi:hypothetical protein
LFGGCVSNGFAQTLAFQPTVTEQDILETISTFKTDSPSKSVEVFKTKMPAVTDAKTRAFVLNNPPKHIASLQIQNPQLVEKVRTLIQPVLALYQREQIYQIVIFRHNVPFIALDSGTSLYLSSELLLEIESVDELLGAVAHEVGHEYFTEYSIISNHLLTLVRNGKETALERKLGDFLAIIELECDAFSALTLTHLGYDPTAFLDRLDNITKRFKVQVNSVHPPSNIRRQVIESIIPPSFIKKDKRKVSQNLLEIKEIIKSQTAILKF